MTSRLFAAGFCLITTILSAASGTWDFEKGAAGWQGPGGESGVIAEPGKAANHVFQIVATKPHHTLLFLQQSEQTPNFIASLRFKVLSWEGEPPNIYVYARHASGGFRGLSCSGSTATAMVYNGQQKENPKLGTIKLKTSINEKAWWHVALAVFQNQLFARVWPEGETEPAKWQIAGEAEGQTEGRFALGVWTSPRTPSKARALFDDFTFRPLNDQDLASLKPASAQRAPLDVKALPKSDGLFETEELAGMIQGSTVLAFSRKTGELTHVVDRTSGQEFLCAAEPRPLFSIHLSQGHGAREQEVSAEDFPQVNLQRMNPREWHLSYSGHPKLALSARVAIALGEDKLIHFRFALSNRTDWAATSIRFPDMVWTPVLGKSVDDDQLILPWQDGALLSHPGTTGQHRTMLYPGHAFTQFTAYYDPSAGVFLGALDPDGHCKEWQLQTSVRKQVQMTLAHVRPEVPGQDAALPYDVVLGTFQGDWMTAADIYKQWAVKQTWCAKPLRERADIPQFLKAGAGLVIASIQNNKGYNGLFGDQLEKLPAVLKTYRDRTELAHIVVVPYGWENRGTWAGINYFPALPSDDAWRKASRALQQQGDRVALLTSGYWWVVKRQATSNGRAFDDSAEFERRKDMVIWNADGQPFVFDNYENTNPGAEWRGLSYKLCHGSAEANDTMKKIFLQAAGLGAALVSFDQEIGGGQREPCYRASHGHPPGYGNWMWTGFRDVSAQILKEGKPIQPELGLLMENVSELIIPHAATFWSRQFGELDHGGPGSRGIGLYSYLYHEYVTCIGAACVQGQGVLGTQPSANLRAFILANNLTRGLIPGPFMNDVPLETKDAWKAQVAQAFFAFSKPYARFPEYLVLGVTRRPPAIRCAEQEVEYVHSASGARASKSDSTKAAKTTAHLPTVTAGTFEASDGSRGTIIVNTTTQPQTATVQFSTSGKPAVLYQPNKTEVQRWEKGPAEITLQLEPLGTRFIVQKP